VRRIAVETRLVYRARILAYLSENPCVDCGETDIRCLEFDHRGSDVKVGDVTRLVNNLVAWHRVEAEIAKCDVRCANCHRRVMAERGKSWRSAAQGVRLEEWHFAAEARLQRILKLT
jgi:hypothetical protein